MRIEWSDTAREVLMVIVSGWNISGMSASPLRQLCFV